jgi:spermidine synthase
MALYYDAVFAASVRFGVKVERTLPTEQSRFQKVEVLETTRFGRMLVIDGLFMTSEKDEFFYHELLVQPTMCSVANPKRVLIIGGGDGGTAREVLRHPGVERCVLIEIDEAVVRASKEWLPGIGTAWDDPRLDVRFGDGVAFVKESDEERFDAIFVDGSDPVGPAEVLFTDAFFEGAKRMLAPGGALVMQSESPIYFLDTFVETQKKLSKLFSHVRPYFGPVPIYSAGIWSWTFCSDAVDPLKPDAARVEALTEGSQVYNADIHRGAFATPNYLQKALTNV